MQIIFTPTVTASRGYHIERFPTREAWLRARRDGIGSSEVGAIAGVNPYDSPLTVWRRHREGGEGGKAETRLMMMGHYLEPMAAQLFADLTGNYVDKESEGDWLAVDDKMPWLRTSPDRIWWPAEIPEQERTADNARILECKSVGEDIEDGNVPRHWFCQVQYQMGVMRLKEACIVWLNRTNGNCGFIYVSFNANLWETMKGWLTGFWKENILGGKRPEISCGSDAQTIWGRQKETPCKVVADEDIMERILRWHETERIREDTSGAVKMALREAGELVDSRGNTLATWKAGKDGVRRLRIVGKKTDV